jgi:4-alpha-glucanotransferase
MSRKSGILLHVTSLPSPYGIGDLGPSAHRFADFLRAAGQKLWQMLPINPTQPGSRNSPYQSYSAFAINPLAISPELLAQESLVRGDELDPPPDFPPDRVEFDAVIACKERIFAVAHKRFRSWGRNREYEKFRADNHRWLDDYALYAACKRHFGGKSWNEWPGEIRDRHPGALGKLENELRDAIDREMFLQYLAFGQWRHLKNYCNERGVRIFGDIPIYVTHDSADVWSNPAIFKLNADKLPRVVAGVPPDYFSKTGQLWGNPLYDWDALQRQRFDWWLRRIEHNLNYFDLARIDHFRGLVACWEVPAGEKSAINGQWVNVPADDFFAAVLEKFSNSRIIAEDLGVITPDVRETMARFGLQGMKILMFAFGDDLPTNPYIPHRHVRDCVVYTGTHDCNTARGWFENELSTDDKNRVFRYLGRQVSPAEISWEMIRLAMMSVADTVIVPMQDILGLGADSRMNLPGTVEGNWLWRMRENHANPDLSARLRQITEIFGRA